MHTGPECAKAVSALGTLLQLTCSVLRNTSTEVSALGAAYLAGLAAGVWSSQDEVAELPRTQELFEPKMTEQQREQLYSGWRKAVAQAML